MTITVLLAPDGSPIAIMRGRQPLDAFCEDLDETQWPDVQGSEVIGYDLYADGYTLAHGYTLEHHDLAELLARPTAKELQAAKAADHASTLEAYKLGSTIQESKIARLEAEIADLRRLVEAAYTEGWEHAAFAEENNAKWMWQTSEAAKALTVKP